MFPCFQYINHIAYVPKPLGHICNHCRRAPRAYYGCERNCSGAHDRDGPALLRRRRLTTLPQMILGRSVNRLPFLAALWAITLLTREPIDLRLGQRAYVDDGTCPQGQVKEVGGA